MNCPICGETAPSFRTIEDVIYFRCNGCGSIFADPDFLTRIETGEGANYSRPYWDNEIASARERSFGSTVIRVAELLRLARIPLTRLLDIGSGPGFLLDALQDLAPRLASHVYGIEAFPPHPDQRTRHPNYKVGSIADLDGKFDGGVCIEVIEHLTPAILTRLVGQLAAKSSPGALYFFNSAQPSFVESDPTYLDPYERGHIVSWSIQGLRKVFEPLGFNIIPLPGRDWAFLAEFGPRRDVDAMTLLDWLWSPVAANLALTSADPFGPLFTTAGVESTRCYLEAAISEARAHWALSLQNELQEARSRLAGP